MFGHVVLGVSVSNSMHADGRLATLAMAIRLGTLCGEVPRLVTIVTDISLTGLRDGGPRGRRGTNRCGRSLRRCPLVLCRVSDFDRRWAGHLELQPEQSVPTWLTPCAPTSEISTVMPPAPRPQVDGLRPVRQATVSTPSQCHEAARKFSRTPCREAR